MKRWTRSEGRKQRACIEEEKPTWHNYWSRYVERDWRGDGGKEEGHGRTKGQLLLYGGSESKSRRRHDAGRISATATAGIAGIGFLSWASVHDA